MLCRAWESILLLRSLTLQKKNVFTTNSGSLNYDGAELDFDSIYSEAFVESINQRADKVIWASDYINEIFMYFFLKIMEYASAFKSSGSEGLHVKGFGNSWSVYISAAKEVNLKVNRGAIFFYYFSNVVLLVYSFLVILGSSLVLPAWVLIRRKKMAQQACNNISVIRSPASYDKMKYLEEFDQVKFYFDDVFQGCSAGQSMYSHGSSYQRILALAVIPCMAIKDYYLILKDTVNLLGWGHAGFVLSYFSKRVAHKCVFSYFLNLILKNNKQVVYYTGNKEDRFAVLEKRLCKKYGVKSVCIPHGIEYAFRSPAGLVGDEFYCTTPFAQKYLSNLYGDDSKFIYDKDIARKMFSRGQPVTNIEQIVFFPESREPAINLSILKTLVESGFSIMVKLHVKDSPDNYKEFSTKFTYIDDFDLAISNKICLARKSTVLVEAIYNNSIPIAVLSDPKDRAYVEYMFPSLQDSQIKKVYAFNELVELLKGIKNNIASSNSHASSQEVG